MVVAAPHRGHPHELRARHARLVHLGTAAGEPQCAASGDVLLVASARIDSRDELARQLGLPGPPAVLDDAAVILAAYSRWGAHAPERLLGDFAYLVFDGERGVLHAARDPMGMRPLYYHHDPRRTLVASEIQQLLATGDVPAEVHEPAVARFLIGEYGVLDETFYRGIRSLRAGHVLEADGRGVRSWPYWRIDPERRLRLVREEDYAEQFRDLFLRAVSDRIRTGDPVGIFLSGGVDSGSIAAALGWLRQRDGSALQIHTYSWATASLPECDERHLSDLVVREYGLTPHDVDADQFAPLAGYPAHGPHRDEPSIGVYQPLLEAGLAAARADGVRAMWSGDRGDLLGGAWVPNYLHLLRRGRWRALANDLREHADVPGQGWAAAVAGQLVRPALRALGRRASRAWRGRVPREPDPRRPPWLADDLLRRTGVDPEVRHDAVAPDALAGHARRKRFELVFVPLHMHGMIWSERTNAAHGLGFVDPWSDLRLAEFVLAIPQVVLNRPGTLDKRLFREAMRGIMPERLRRDARKIVPKPLYLRALRGSATATVRALTRDMEAERRGYLHAGTLREHFDEILRGNRDHPEFWSALNLEMWLRRYWT